jgi:hypothetical protein
MGAVSQQELSSACKSAKYRKQDKKTTIDKNDLISTSFIVILLSFSKIHRTTILFAIGNDIALEQFLPSFRFHGFQQRLIDRLAERTVFF